ncbi:MAG: isoprenylcysteine carboxylmethyltransferase family protein [Agarilytica sp.]
MSEKKRLKIPPPVYMLGCIDLVIALDYLFPSLSFYFPHQAMCALGVASIGIVFVAHAGLSFFIKKTTVNPFKLKDSGTLVTSGFYRVSRNPMYLGMAVIIVSSGLYFGSVLAILPLALFVFIMNSVQIRPEEQALKEIFGGQYTAYTQRVRRWI